MGSAFGKVTNEIPLREVVATTSKSSMASEQSLLDIDEYTFLHPDDNNIWTIDGSSFKQFVDNFEDFQTKNRKNFKVKTGLSVVQIDCSFEKREIDETRNVDGEEEEEEDDGEGEQDIYDLSDYAVPATMLEDEDDENEYGSSEEDSDDASRQPIAINPQLRLRGAPTLPSTTTTISATTTIEQLDTVPQKQYFYIYNNLMLAVLFQCFKQYHQSQNQQIQQQITNLNQIVNSVREQSPTANVFDNFEVHLNSLSQQLATLKKNVGGNNNTA